MPFYIYKAKNASAQTIKGRLHAQNQDEALEVINTQGLVPVTIEEETAGGVLMSDIKVSRVKSKDLYLFTKQLSGLVKSGVVLLKGLEVISRQTRSPYFSKVLSEVTSGVRSGRSFSTCLADYPSVFSSLYVSLVRAGEEMGHLREALIDIAEFQKRQDEINRKLNTALVYPVLMLVAGFVTVIFILTFVMPKISVIFLSTGEQLPWPTVVVMKASHFLKLYWPYVILACAVLVMGFRRWRASSSGKVTIGRWLLSLPYIGMLVIKTDIARFARTTYLLLNSGLTLVRAIEVAAPTVENPQLKADLFLCVEGLNAGESLGNCLGRSANFPEVFTQVLTVAEEGGSLDGALKDIAESCEDDVNQSIRAMMTLLEPAMILGVGLIVGFIVFAMLLPIFSMDIMAR